MAPDRHEKRPTNIQLRKLNRTYALLSAVNRAIVRERNQQAIFESACRIAVDQGKFRMAWIGILDPESGRVHLVAQAGATGEYLDALKNMLDQGEHRSNPTSSALSTGKYVVINDITHDPRIDAWREDALRMGYHSTAIFPLMVRSEARAILCLYAAEPDYFDRTELPLLSEMAADLSFALELAEREAQRSQAVKAKNEMSWRYYALVEQASDSFFVHDFEGRFIEVNQHACESLGYSKEELLQMTVMDVEQELDLVKAQAEWAKIEPGKPFTLFGHHKRKDGTIFPVEVRLSCSLWKGQKLFLVLARDITERKRAEEVLRESEERYHNILEAAPVGIAVHSKGKIVFINLAGTRILGGESEEQFVGRSILDIIHTDRLEAPQARIQRMLAGEVGLHPIEDTYLRLDGTPIQVEVMATTLYYEGKLAVQVIVTDISERKKAEEELRLHRDQLAELSRRLLNVHETEQYAIGRELHDQIGQMLTALRLTLNILHELPVEQAAKKLAGAQELVDDLLNRVSRLSLELRPPMLDDLGLLPALLWRINQYQEQTGIEVTFKHLGLEGKRLNSEVETAAYRIIQEALTNVTRHADGKHIKLQIQVRETMLKINIKDDGKGFIPHEVYARRQSSGLIGMRERAGLLNGKFQVQSQPGEGTMISVELPIGDNAI